MIARFLVYRDRLACKSSFVDCGISFDDHAVDRDVLARMDYEFIIDPDLSDRNLDLQAVSDNDRSLRSQLHQTLKRIGRFALGPRLEHFAHRDQSEDHGG